MRACRADREASVPDAIMALCLSRDVTQGEGALPVTSGACVPSRGLSRLVCSVFSSYGRLVPEQLRHDHQSRSREFQGFRG